MTAARLREIADELDAEGLRVLDAGDREGARELFRRAENRRAMADVLEEEARGGRALPSGQRSGNVQGEMMTDEQLARRGRATAKTRAAKTEDPRRIAIAARWGSLRKAAAAAGVSPGALVGYLDGLYACPESVAAVFAADRALPANAKTWPRGIVK